VLLDGKNAAIYGAGGSIGGAGNVAAFAASDHARTITASAINITCGSVAG